MAWLGEKHFSSWLWALEKMHHNLSHERDLCNFPADQNISLSPHVFLWVTSRENALNQHILQKRQMMTFESLMLIAQLLFFYPGRSGIVQISCDMSFKLNIWKALCGGKKIIIYIYMHFLSMPCHLKYKMVRGKKKKEYWTNFLCLSGIKQLLLLECFFIVLLFLGFFLPLLFSNCFAVWKSFCVLQEHYVPPSGYWAQVDAW